MSRANAWLLPCSLFLSYTLLRLSGGTWVSVIVNLFASVVCVALLVDYAARDWRAMERGDM